MTQIRAADHEGIGVAAALIRGGEVVAFPTETVYGLGANALDGAAVARIFEAKGRPRFNPLIVHVPDAADVQTYAVMNDRAREVAAAFWPGPLTLILPRRKDCPISDLATAGLQTLAIRVPAHPVARTLLLASGVPIAAPSANASGEPSPTTPLHVAQSLGGRIPLILAGGACAVGLESTVLDLSGDTPLILRPGAVTGEDLFPLLGPVGVDAGEGERPRSPGQLLRHYAPSIPLRLNAIDLEPGEALLAFSSTRFMGIRGGGAASSLPEPMIRNLSEDGDLHEAAANLFAHLRALDHPPNTRIAVMNIPDKGLGIAINDRLNRAARGR